ncbi:hypothetical protein V1477_015465 [Vespula maculifrons]|uniref:Uncharacterized protein n=1 Tax=Vespula maculifrons TaxID=7453 RepID=A0ABD2BFV8_VESMC
MKIFMIYLDRFSYLIFIKIRSIINCRKKNTKEGASRRPYESKRTIHYFQLYSNCSLLKYFKVRLHDYLCNKSLSSDKKTGISRSIISL